MTGILVRAAGSIDVLVAMQVSPEGEIAYRVIVYRSPFHLLGVAQSF